MGTGSRASVSRECRWELSEDARRSPATARFDRARRRPHGRTRRPGRRALARTTELRPQVPPRLRVLAGTAGSSFGEAPEDTCADILPWLAGRLARHHASGTPLDFADPGCLNFGSIGCGGFSEPGKDSRGHIGPL